MTFPPMLLRIHIRDNGRTVSLWIPLFLVWLLLLVIAIALAPLIILIALLAWPAGWGRTLLFAGPAFARLACAMRGLKVDVNDPRQKVFISFY
jgi:hypothetical protein